MDTSSINSSRLYRIREATATAAAPETGCASRSRSRRRPRRAARRDANARPRLGHRLGPGRLGPRGLGRLRARAQGCGRRSRRRLFGRPRALRETGRRPDVPGSLREGHARRAGIATGAVGLITELGEARSIVADGGADLVSFGRLLLRDPYWPLRNAPPERRPTPKQYLRAFPSA